MVGHGFNHDSLLLLDRALHHHRHEIPQCCTINYGVILCIFRQHFRKFTTNLVAFHNHIVTTIHLLQTHVCTLVLVLAYFTHLHTHWHFLHMYIYLSTCRHACTLCRYACTLWGNTYRASIEQVSRCSSWLPSFLTVITIRFADQYEQWNVHCESSRTTRTIVHRCWPWKTINH